MKTIQTTAVVGSDHRLTAQVPDDVPPGEHRVVVVIEEKQAKHQPQPLHLAAYPVGFASDTFTCRREELYGDDGR